MKNSYVLKVYGDLQKKYPEQTEFLNAIKEVFSSLEIVFDKNPDLEKTGILERLSEPENVIKFDVDWVDDAGNKQTNKGYRVQYCSIMGPYKGGLRFNQNVSESLFKSLALEQTFKNTLTGFPMGGAKGGSDFNPIGKSEKEIETYCHEFMKKLYPYIGAETDIPAGDLGVGGREVSYLLDEYTKHKSDIGAITGKPVGKGGLKGRTEATGFGLCYFVEEMLNDHNDSFKGKRVIVSGSGNVGSHALKKAIELGATVIGTSDYTGYVIDENGIDYDIVAKIRDQRKTMDEYPKYCSSAKYYKGPTGLFNTPCDIILPCATQGEIDLKTAKIIVKNGVKLVGEGSNLPCSLDAIDYLIENGVMFTPAKASNAGGVSCSYFEMCQNKEGREWTFEETDKKLKETMVNIYHHISDTAKKYDQPNNLLLGANIWAFEKILETYLKNK